MASVLFAASYMFLIQPVFWESPDVDVVAAGTFAWEHGKADDYAYFRPEETFIMDNGDATFSLYIDGEFAVDNVDITNDGFKFLPMRERDDD